MSFSRILVARYTIEACVQLTREWCRRAHWFYMCFVDAEDQDLFFYTPEHVTGYVETEKFLDFMIALPVESAAFEEGFTLCPRMAAG